MAAPEPSLRLTGYLTAAGGVGVALVSANAEGLRIGSLNHTLGPAQFLGVALGLVVMTGGIAAATRTFQQRFPGVVRLIGPRPQVLWLTPRLVVLALAIVTILMAGRGLDAATCPYPGPDNAVGEAAAVVGSEIIGDTLVCSYGGGL